MANILEDTNLAPQPTLFDRAWAFARKQPLGTAGLFVVILFVVMAAFAPYLTFHDPESGEFFNQFVRPFSTSEMNDIYYVLGADEFGRDVFTRIVYGARTALVIGLVCSILGSVIGLVLGVASAYFGGWTDTIMQRVMDVLMAFPLIILALTISIASKGFMTSIGIENPNDYSIYAVIVAITIPFIPKCARVVRSSA
ncbi:MAG: ABC transporter permease, partial [Pseudomonadota bacterium]